MLATRFSHKIILKPYVSVLFKRKCKEKCAGDSHILLDSRCVFCSAAPIKIRFHQNDVLTYRSCIVGPKPV